MMPIHDTTSSPPTCVGFFPELTDDHTRQKVKLSLANCPSARDLGDGFMVADVAPMDPKFGWWNVLDGALLQRFSYEKPQSPIERWFRLEKKAAKVGKGLVKNGKARKLVSQHWLEAVDPLHRYGHNLRFYFEAWCQSETSEPFFYWLDSGEGKDLELKECTKETLQSERIRYLGPVEREQYEVTVEDGKLLYKRTGEPVNSTKGDKWIFVMSTSGVLYVGKKERGILQHSSFLAGAAITSAGRLRVEDGIIKQIEAHSGHYRPTPENFKQVMSILESRGADLSTAKIQYSSKEMIKPSKTLKFLQGDGNKDKVKEDDSPTASPSLASQGSLSSQGSADAADGQLMNESREKQDVLSGFRDHRLNGNHDIFKRERCSDKGDYVDESNRRLESSVVTNNRSERSSGTSPKDEQLRNKAHAKHYGGHRESDMGVEGVPTERLDSDLKEKGPNHVDSDLEQTAQSVQELLSLEDEEVVEGTIEEVIDNPASRAW